MVDERADVPLRRAIAGPCVGQYVRSPARPATLRNDSTYAAMSPSGGDTTVVLHPITWSPGNSTACSSKAKHVWFDVCPGVCTARNVQPGPVAATSPSVTRRSGRNAKSVDSSTLTVPLLGAALVGESAGSGGGWGP